MRSRGTAAAAAAQWSHKSLLVTIALIAPVFAVLLEVVLELREVLEQAVRFFLSYFLLVSKVVRAE